MNSNLGWLITSQILQEVEMRKAITNLEIIYEQVEVSSEESQQKLNEMFDILFDETLQYLKEKIRQMKLQQKENSYEKGGEQKLWIEQQQKLG